MSVGPLFWLVNVITSHLPMFLVWTMACRQHGYDADAEAAEVMATDDLSSALRELDLAPADRTGEGYQALLLLPSVEIRFARVFPRTLHRRPHQTIGQFT